MSERIRLDSKWQFAYGCENIEDAQQSAFQEIEMPHTWNDLDGQDGGGDYRRGKGWYKKIIKLNKESEKEYWLEFLGVNSVCNVYVNGIHLGEHRGGYTLFRMEATQSLASGSNIIMVCADNSPFADVIPLTADFTFFGGIYREVNLVVCGKCHFALDDNGSDGIKLSYENSPPTQGERCA